MKLKPLANCWQQLRLSTTFVVHSSTVIWSTTQLFVSPVSTCHDVHVTGVDKGGTGPQWPDKKELTQCLHLKDDISVTDILKISKITCSRLPSS